MSESKQIPEIDQIIKLSETDLGAIIIVKKREHFQQIVNLKHYLRAQFPTKSFIIVFGEDIEVIKI